MSDKISEYIKREMAGKKDTAPKLLEVYREDVLWAFPSAYIKSTGLFFYLDRILKQDQPELAVISTKVDPSMQEEMIDYFHGKNLPFRFSNVYDEGDDVLLVLKKEGAQAEDPFFQPDVPTELYDAMGGEICGDCMKKIRKEYGHIASEFRRQGPFSGGDCEICGN